MTRCYIVPKIGSVKLADLTPGHVERMQRAILKDGKSARTARLSRSVLRAGLKHAERHGLLARNAAALAEPVKADHNEKDAMSVDQVRKLFAAAAGTREEAPIRVLVTLGLRRGELLGLQWPDVDFTRNTIRVRRALERGTQGLEVSEVKTQRSARTLQLPQGVAETLKAHRTRQKEERLRAGAQWVGGDWLFTNAWGGPIDPDNFRHRFADVCDRAGIGHWTPHSLRHTAGTLMFEHGADLKVVSETLGHSSIRVTADIYAHLMPERTGEAVAPMDRALT